MRTMEGDVQLNVPVQTAWKMYRDDRVMSKVNPGVITNVVYTRGSGEPGSIRQLKFGPDVQDFVAESTQMIEKVDDGRSVTYSVVAGDLPAMYDPYRVNFSFVPVVGEETKKCVVQWKAEFEPISPAVPPPERARDIALGFIGRFDKLEAANLHN